jgi:hypothetical protein
MSVKAFGSCTVWNAKCNLLRRRRVQLGARGQAVQTPPILQHPKAHGKSREVLAADNWRPADHQDNRCISANLAEVWAVRPDRRRGLRRFSPARFRYWA